MKTEMMKMLSCCFLIAGGMMMAGCSTDDDIDVGEVDTLLGVGTNGFTIPGGGSDPIQLINIFKINDSDCIDTINGGNYRFFKNDDGIDATDVKIDPVTVDLDANKIQTYRFVVPIQSTHGSRDVNLRRATQTFSKTITTFDFTESNLTGAIRQLKTAEVAPVPFKLTETFSAALVSALEEFSDLDLEMPDFFGIKDNKVRVKNGGSWSEVPIVDGVIHLTGIATNANLELEGYISSMDFTKAPKTHDGNIQELNFNASSNFKEDKAKVVIKGLVLIEVKYDESKLSQTAIEQLINIGKTDTDFFIDSEFRLGLESEYKPKMEFRDVEGRFFPDIDLSIDPVKIKDIPDFLTKDGVKIDLADLFLELGVKSTMPLPGTVDVKMTPIIKKSKKAAITVSGIKIKQEANSKILISRKDNSSKSGYTDYHWSVKEDGSDDIGKLLTNIPDEIEFICDAKADSSNYYKVYLNKKYSIKPTYFIEAPLSLNSGSCIVYDDSTDDWNKDLNDNDVDLDGNTTLTVEGEIINNTPLVLEIEKPTPRGVGDADISSIVNVNMSKISVSPNSSSKISMVVTTTGDGLKKLDGIKYSVYAKSNGNTTPLNGRKHTIQIKDMKATLNGKITINLDN